MENVQGTTAVKEGSLDLRSYKIETGAPMGRVKSNGGHSSLTPVSIQLIENKHEAGNGVVWKTDTLVQIARYYVNRRVTILG